MLSTRTLTLAATLSSGFSGATNAQQVPVRSVTVTWGTSPRTTDGCWFFSGPGALGRGTPLGTRATLTLTPTVATLDFGGGAVFNGTRHGASVVLTRIGSYDSAGPWSTLERIHATISENTLRGDYHYDECEKTSGNCPGECHIDVDVGVGMNAGP